MGGKEILLSSQSFKRILSRRYAWIFFGKYDKLDPLKCCHNGEFVLQMGVFEKLEFLFKIKAGKK